MRLLKAAACLITAIALVYLPFYLLDLFSDKWWTFPTMLMCGFSAMMLSLIGTFYIITEDD